MSEPVETKERRAAWGLALGLVVFALVLVAVVYHQRPTPPRGADAPATEFSAGRAVETLRALAGDGSPHPVGSPADDRIREAILAELRRLGLSPEVQDGMACSAGGVCARVRNVLARLDGTSPGPAVLLMAHYDSVAAGPGVADDLSGVATILEAARALKAGPPLKNPVLLLLDEGEEAGLLGAELFAASPALKQVGVIVNLEARGTSGPSLMFETSGDDAWMVRLYAAAAPHPVTSSLYATVYDLMPNDTDLTVFKRSGVNGLNFAFVRHPSFYHTNRDTVDNLSQASLQHHGDNALAAARAFGGADLASPPKGDAVFFDVLGLAVIRWPKGWTVAFGSLALVLVLGAVGRSLRRKDVPPRGLLFGLLGFLATLVVAALLSYGLFIVMRSAFPAPWVDRPWPEIAAFWLLGTAVAMLLAAWLSRRAGAAGLWSGIWIGWAVLGLAVTFTAPGIAYLFIVPALVAGLAGLFLAAGGTAAALIPGAVAALLWFPILFPLYDGLGAQALVAIGLLVAALATTLAPLVPAAGMFGRRWLPLGALALMAVCAGLAFASPPFSKDTPQPLPFQLLQDAETGKAQWVILTRRPLPEAVRQAAPFSPSSEPVYPWAPVRGYLAPAPHLDVPGPQLAVLEDNSGGGKRHLRLLLTSNRQAPEAAVFLPAEAKLESAKVDGVEIPFQARRRRARPAGLWQFVGVVTLPPDGVELEIVLGDTRPRDWYLYDLSHGLPPSGEALRKARPDSAVPFQDGDTVAVSRKARI